MANLLDGMDKVYSRLVPELGRADMPVEHKATCLNCAMAPKIGADPEKPASFPAKARCCTYQPTLSNHVVGRVLRRGDVGTERMVARIGQGGGVSAFGVGPTAEWTERYRVDAAALFGRSPEITCPYWADQAYGCTIWRDRNSTCRTWYCKHENAERGRVLWLDARDAIDSIDKMVAAYLVSLGTPPYESATPTEWADWYRWCAERVDLFDAVDLEQVRRPHTLALFEALGTGVPALERLPEVVVPSLLEWFVMDEAVLATAYSAYDLDVLPPRLFAFLSRLDGTRPWRELLDGEPGIDEALVAHLWQRGLLSAPDAAFRSGQTAVAFREGPWSAVPDLQESITAAFSQPTPPESEG